MFPEANETGTENMLIIGLHSALLRLLASKVVCCLLMSQGWIRPTKTRVFLRLRHHQPRRYAVAAKAKEERERKREKEFDRATLILIMTVC